jgi:hypothetical protein
MARLARLVVAGLPHHVTQRGNRRESIFFEDGDQDVYRDLLAEQARKAVVEVWALLPDAESCPPHSPSCTSGRPRASSGGSTSTLETL